MSQIVPALPHLVDEVTGEFVGVIGLDGKENKLSKSITDSSGRVLGVSGSFGSVISPLKSAQFPTVIIGNSIMWYGDESGTLSGKPFHSITNRNIVDQLNARMGQPLKILNRAGVSGNTIPQMVARFPTDVLAYRPRLVIMEGLSNDGDQGYSADQIMPSVLNAYRLSISIGAIFMFLGTSAMRRTNASTPVSPIDGVQYNESAEIAKMEAYCREAAATLPGFIFSNMAEAGRDYSVSAQETSFGTPLAGITSDGTHPLPYGAHILKEKIFSDLGNFFAGATQRAPTLNGFGTGGDQSMLLQNSLLSGSAAVTAPNTGNAPLNYNVTVGAGAIRALLCDVVPRTDGGPGKKMVLPISLAAATTDYIEISGSASYNKAIGLMAYLQAGIKVTSVTSGQVVNIIGNLQFLDSGFAVIAQTFFGRPHSAFPSETLGIPGVFDLGIASTKPYAVPPGTTRIAITIRIYTTVGASLTVEITNIDSRVDTVSQLIQSYLP